ncbi:MAG: YndJ family transporter [Planctomycetes bacterium]|nr:YndJ family transporter [Planctomycetota bacterium]
MTAVLASYERLTNSHAAKMGTAAWLVLLAVALPNLTMLRVIELAVLLAAFALMPQAFVLLHQIDPGEEDAAFRAARMLQPTAAALAAVSFFLPQGPGAAALAAPWAAVCGLVSLSGLLRFRRHGIGSFEQAAVRAGMLLLSVGGSGLVQSRLGMQPFGFVEPIVLLTAVHYHFTAFFAPLIAASTLRAIAKTNSILRAPGRAATAGLITATPLLALGFICSNEVKVAAAILLTGSLFVLGLVAIATIPRFTDWKARALLGVSSASLVAGMVLGAVFAITEFRGNLALSIPEMAWSHGILNGLGFAACGLTGWNLAFAKERGNL